MYRFLFSSKWLGYLLLAAIFAAACVFLGRWQMDRRAETLAEINRVLTNYSAAPVPFSAVEDEFSELDPAKEWTQVELRGRYDADGQRIVRNRPLNGQPGYEVVVPFKLATGETVVIDRGWLPIGNNNPGRPDSIPAPPTGEVTAVVRLKAGEPTLQRGAPEGQLASIDLPAYAEELGYPAADGGLRPACLGNSARSRDALPVPDALHGGRHAPVVLPAMVCLRRAHVYRVRIRRTAAGQECCDRRRRRRGRRRITEFGQRNPLCRGGSTPSRAGPPETETPDGRRRRRRPPRRPGLLTGRRGKH